MGLLYLDLILNRVCRCEVQVTSLAPPRLQCLGRPDSAFERGERAGRRREDPRVLRGLGPAQCPARPDCPEPGRRRNSATSWCPPHRVQVLPPRVTPSAVSAAPLATAYGLCSNEIFKNNNNNKKNRSRERYLEGRRVLCS